MLVGVGERRVAIIGGGPGGLTAAMILKRRNPTWSVVVWERNPPEQTFGYGVGLLWSAFGRLSAADASCASDIEASSVTTTTWTIRRDGEHISASNSHGIAIERAELLRVLARHAQAAGVEVRSGAHVGLADVAGADVVLAADGVGSEVRTALAADLGATVTTGDLLYLWCGADLGLARMDGMVLALSRTPSGPLAAHVMPYGAASSTFQVDATADVVRGWGLPDDPVEAEKASRALLESQYRDLLGEARVRTKRTDWSAFATVRCERWSSGNVALVGDAAHTAHYTVGSGTALAVDDGITIADALTGAGSISDAFAAYESARQPRVASLQARAERSERWWSTLRLRIDLPLPQLMLSYLTRTGALSLADVTASNPDIVSECDGLASGGTLDGTSAAVLRVDSTDVDAHVERVRALVDSAATEVCFDGPSGRDAVMDRLDVAERVRALLGLTTIVRGDADARDDLTVGLLTNRTDFVEIAG